MVFFYILRCKRRNGSYISMEKFEDFWEAMTKANQVSESLNYIMMFRPCFQQVRETHIILIEIHRYTKDDAVREIVFKIDVDDE